jgi:hypothetical protein
MSSERAWQRAAPAGHTHRAQNHHRSKHDPLMVVARYIGVAVLVGAALSLAYFLLAHNPGHAGFHRPWDIPL